ncbi:MFS transporter [Jeotgalibacillus terrae]|uniref:MFS transporter n=1 Tax=Jeotgalibacillus terrae TaxID=587735 RepID=A0ABW5ZDN5_9BACL|nr:MFS transporter [Jeotgalibacillus terrae]MBM7579495.1 PPP family 3-phenylpropionic acid transporter [Jeotgalibacillus terrae]
MKAQSWLSINFFTFFFTWGIFLPYWTGWLVYEKDLTVAAASSIIAAGLFARSFSTLYLFPELSKRFSLAFLMRALPVISTCILLLFIPVDSFTGLMIVMILFSLFYPNILPMMESNASLLMRTDNIHYGRSRSWGSVGYTVGLIIVGLVTAIWTESAIFAVMAVGSVMMIAGAFQYAPDALQEKVSPKRGSYKAVFKTPGFMLVISICVLIQGAHASYYNYGFIYLQELNVSNAYIGFILNIAVLSEILFFAVADRFFKDRPAAFMFFIASIAAVVRWALVGLFPSLWIFLITQLFHSLTFGLAHYAFIRYLYRSVDKQLIPTAQGVYASLGMGLSAAVLTQVGGLLYDIDSGLAFTGMSIAVMPAILLSIVMHQKRIA